MKRFARHSPILLAALWVAAAWYYWRTSVRLPPECVFQFSADRQFRGFASNGDAILLKQVPQGSRPDGHEQFGPIEFWRLPERTKIREVFTNADAIDNSHPDALGRIIVIREGKAWLGDFQTGELLEELPGVETKRSNRDLFKDRLISIRDQTAVVYDLTSKRVLASHAGQLWTRQIFDTLWCLHAAVPDTRGGYTSGDAIVLDIATGQIDHRFDHLGGALKSVTGSSDGKFAVASTATATVVCELPSGNQLWSMPPPKHGYLRFEKNSAALTMEVLDEKQQVRTARWRAIDGTVIDAFPAQSSDWAHRDSDAKGRYCIDNKSFQKGPVGHAFSQVEYHVRRWMGVRTQRWPLDRRWISEVRDLNADQPIGVYSYDQESHLISPDGSGFITVTDVDYEAHRLRYYRLPPGRDRWWLVWWGLLPPIAFVLLRRGANSRAPARTVGGSVP